MATDKIQEAAKEYAEKKYPEINDSDATILFARVASRKESKESFISGAIWQEQQGWVRVDTPPEEWQIIDTWNGKVNRRAIFDAGKFYRHFDLADGDRVARVYYPDITHYRPLPSPPGSTPIESKEGKYRAALEEIIEAVSGTGTTMRIVRELATEALKP